MAATKGTATPTSRDEEKTLIRFATLLGAFRLSKNPTAKGDNSIFRLISHDATCSVPSLSLLSSVNTTNQEEQPSSDDFERSQAEEHAVSNLSRPLCWGHCAKDDDDDDDTDDSPVENSVIRTTIPKDDSLGENVMDAPQHVVLENLSKSFLVLVEARLRAYITILARHGVSFSECPGLSLEEQEEGVLAIERKLATLIDIGTKVEIRNIVTSFSASTRGATVNGENTKLPLVMESTMDVFVPSHSNRQTNVTFLSRTTGSIEGSFGKNGTGDCKLQHVAIELDTHDLLSQLVNHAGQVMTVVVNNVKEVCTLPPQVPPAPPLPSHPHEKSTRGKTTKTLRLKRMVHDLRVVSPDLHSKAAPQHPHVPPFDLDNCHETDTSLLSPQSCANIVDFVIGEVNQELIRPPLKKRPKLV